MLSDARRTFLSTPDLSSLPTRIHDRIRERDWANELLLRSIQLTIIAIFCVIYAVSPKTHPDGAMAIAPYVLATYLALSLIGIVWCYFREPPDWASYVSIIFDFALLYGLMVSFHIQYEQPATFVLKAPALLYVFIFIAIRALRFNPKFVLFAGFAAMAGWAAIMVYVTRIDPHDSMLTRSYVDYLTSNSILIGAEIDKLLSILLVTAVLALAVNGSRNFLVTAMTEGIAAAEFARFFDAPVARNIRFANERLVPGKAERQHVAVLTVDIRGFTKIAERCDPDTVMRILAAYQGRVLPLVHAEGGVIDKFIGDGILAGFGLGRISETLAADALRAAEAILRDARSWLLEPDFAGCGGPLEIGIGVASGPVSWGTVGRDERLEMTVIGSPVNLAAKLEKLNKHLGSVCIVEAASWRLGIEQGYDGRFSAAPRRVAVEGMDNEVDVMVLSLPALDTVPILEAGGGRVSR
ncbi:adenylate/guanylate cyclase domain-containing protein [Nitratireductor sp. CAU 1489]|uniref:Adenylate/guanylate cyclase domain-containing protein n=1 Tax=Nitratireductor arenosus TaxID=2682096 RepID=A0A844QCR5_9HYPH|nr:adenylate/guanylate cyclase domain-containing protein [Nitratireductor arenosus]MVA96414.1 adenylate/guanylate cyclase domain-containing protein [Nitratireductor arenosus]